MRWEVGGYCKVEGCKNGIIIVSSRPFIVTFVRRCVHCASVGCTDAYAIAFFFFLVVELFFLVTT